MKNIFRILTATAIGIAALSSCSKEQKGEVYTPGDGDGVYTFYRSEEPSVSFSPENPTMTIELVRATNSGSATLELVSQQVANGQACNAFNIPSSVTFQDGEYETTIEVGYIEDNISMNTTYSVVISMNEEDCSPAGNVSTSFQAIRAFDWKSIGEGLFQDTFAYGITDEEGNVVDPQNQTVAVEQAYDSRNGQTYARWRIVNPFGNREAIAASWGEGAVNTSYSSYWEFYQIDEEGHLYFNTVQPGILYSGAYPVSYAMPLSYADFADYMDYLTISPTGLVCLANVPNVSIGYFGVYRALLQMPEGFQL